MNSKRSSATQPHTNIPHPTSDGQWTFFVNRVHPPSHVNRWMIFLLPPTSAYKTPFLGLKLGEILKTMSFAKSVPKGLKLSACKWGIGSKHSPRETIRPTTSCWHYLTWEASWKLHYGCPGLPSSSYCMCTQWFMHANKWSMTWSSPQLKRLS